MLDVDEVKRCLDAAGLSVTKCERLGNDAGHQIRCKSGEIVNVFDSGSITV